MRQLYMVNRECESGAGNPGRALYRIIIKRLFERPRLLHGGGRGAYN